MDGLTLLTPPTGEPVSLAEAKRWLRIPGDDDSEDADVLALVAEAREWAEEHTGRQLVSAQYRLALSGFPCGGAIRLPRAPLQAVTQVRYYDTAEALQTLPATYYDADAARQPGRVTPAYGQTWPATYDRPDAVMVDFWCGHGPETEIPADVSAGSQTVTPNSMEGVYAGTVLRVGEGQLEETVVVSSVTSTTFTATFRRNHVDPVPVRPGLPRRVLQAVRMMVTRAYEWRGDEASPDAARAREAARDLLTTAWTGEYL